MQLRLEHDTRTQPILMLFQILVDYKFSAKGWVEFKLKHTGAANTDCFDAVKDPNAGP
jgi:hypothetical protein